MKKRKSALTRLEQFDTHNDSTVVSNIEEVQEHSSVAVNVPLSSNTEDVSPLSRISSNDVQAEPEISSNVDDTTDDNTEHSTILPLLNHKSDKRKRRRRFKKTPIFETVSSQEEPLDKIIDIEDEDQASSNNETVLEDTLDVDYMLSQDKEERAERRSVIIKRINAVLLIVGCVYMLFLIYGVFNTTYIYNDKGEIVPQKMTVTQIRETEQYSEIITQYRVSRMLYEKVLTLDYRIAAGVEDPKLVAPEYEDVLEDVESLSIQIQALEVPAKYSQIKNMLSTWVQTDVAVYCQRMSQAVSQDNAEYAQQAMQYRTVMYDDFSLITENVVVMGQNIDGVDIRDIIEWSPDKYVRDNLGAID